MKRPSSINAAILVGLGAAIGWLLMRQRTKGGVFTTGRQMGTRPMPEVRNAGRGEMAMPPRSWDIVDEQVDESFPASDPPGTY